jgi:DNA repair exonuclease SbcCD ATPase subunit
MQRMVGIILVYIGVLVIVTGLFMFFVGKRNSAMLRSATEHTAILQAIAEEQAARHRYEAASLLAQQQINTLHGQLQSLGGVEQKLTELTHHTDLQETDLADLRQQIGSLTGQVQAFGGVEQKLTDLEHHMGGQDADVAELKTLIGPIAKTYLQMKTKDQPPANWTNMPSR